MICPICRSPTSPGYRPFCSRRCADLDLGKWLNGSYAIASVDPEDVVTGGPETEIEKNKLH
jgi:uncharacterized protein